MKSISPENYIGSPSRVLCFISSIYLLLSGSSALAVPYTWYWDSNNLNNQPHQKFESPEAACAAYYDYALTTWPQPKYLVNRKSLTLIREVPFVEYTCRLELYSWYTPRQMYAFVNNPDKAVHREGDSCAPGESFNPKTHYCNSSSEPQIAKHKGEPDKGQGCGPTGAVVSNATGNPIRFSVGNKYQVEADYMGGGASPLSFSRYYNSIDGQWSHTYSTHLIIDSVSAILVDATGGLTSFFVVKRVATADNGDFGKLVQSGSNWVYTSLNNDQQTFNSAGKLVSIVNAQGVKQTLTYSGANAVTVADSFGNSLSFSQDALFRPLTLQVSNLNATYSYGSSQQLARADLVREGQQTTRTYHYEVPGKPMLLTGITDERGVRFATWAYDDQDRAISSEHAGGAGKVLISYNADGSSTVTNELGKQTTYRYQVIQGVKRITAVEGEPSANCPASNSTYTYNDRGQVLTKTDAKGFITTYAYNDRGLETSRTEASGTPQARTTTTIWHATFNLPLTVTEGGQVTTYTYDAQGRQTSRTQSAL